MLFHQFVDGMLQTSGHELVFQRDRQHHHLIVVAGFEFRHRFAPLPYEPLFFKVDSPLFRQFQRQALAAGCHENKPTKRTMFFERKMPRNGTWQHVSLHAMFGVFCRATMFMGFPTTEYRLFQLRLSSGHQE